MLEENHLIQSEVIIVVISGCRLGSRDRCVEENKSGEVKCFCCDVILWARSKSIKTLHRGFQMLVKSS